MRGTLFISKCCCKFGLGQRHAQSLLMFFGVVIAYALRSNIGLAIVAIEQDATSAKTINSSSDPNIKMKLNGVQKGTIFGSFFLGYTFLQIPAGTLARKYGTSIQLSVAIALSGVVTMVTPIITLKYGWIGLSIARMFTGLFEGFLYPCVNQHLAKWIPPEERSRLFAFTFGGSIVGNGIMSCAGGLLAAGPGGWQSIFYVSGSVAILWGILCAIFGFNTPKDHKYITQEEKFYIENSQVGISKDNNEMVTPWKEIWLSIPVWALLSTFLGNIWGFYTLLNLTPTYIAEVLRFPINQNGFLSALPYIVMWIFNIMFSVIADYLINKNILTMEVSRKMWNTISQYGPGICLLYLAFSKTNAASAIILITISSALNAAMYVGYLMNPTDLSPNFTGTLMGLANGLANISAILGPLVSSIILENPTNKQEWSKVFVMTAVIYFVGSTIFLFFGSTQVQPWNESISEKKKDKLNMTVL